MQMMNTDFSKVVRHALIERDMKVKDIPPIEGLAPERVSAYLNGVARWNEESMRKICSALGIDIIFEIRKDERRN